MKLLLQPLPVRVFHWMMFVCVMVLLATGLYLNSPPDYLLLPMSLMRKLHGIFAAILIANTAGQVYYYIYTGKYPEVLFLPHDLKNLRSFARYYLFITDSHPNFGRYNPGQKALFTAWFIAIVIAAITGMALWIPEHSLLLQRLLGGLINCRIIQYFVAVFFAATIPLHIYLVFTEDPAKLQAIITGYIKKEPKAK